MNGLIKRMCILKQLKTGFSADGNPLSGVVRVERYGKLCAMQISLINFAPLSDGRYVCVLCDKQGERLIFPLTPGVGEYNTESSPFNPEKGFCALVCFFKNGAECIAAGQYGSGGYNLKILLDGLGMPEQKPQKKKPNEAESAETAAPPEREIIFVKPQKYDDEAISQSNYYAEENDGEQGNFTADIQDENAVATSEKKTQNGNDAAKNDQGKDVLRPFKITDGQSYYFKIKDELEELFSSNPRADELTRALPESEWVQVKDSGGCLVGIVRENLQVRYITYALPARGKTPPEDLENACFIPVDPLSGSEEGYYVLFQDAATGECVNVKQG